MPAPVARVGPQEVYLLTSNSSIFKISSNLLFIHENHRGLLILVLVEVWDRGADHCALQLGAVVGELRDGSAVEALLGWALDLMQLIEIHVRNHLLQLVKLL